MSIEFVLREISDEVIVRGRAQTLTAEDVENLNTIIEACDEVQELYKDFNLILADCLGTVAREERTTMPIPYASILERLNRLVEHSDGLRQDAVHFIVLHAKAQNSSRAE